VFGRSGDRRVIQLGFGFGAEAETTPANVVFCNEPPESIDGDCSAGRLLRQRDGCRGLVQPWPPENLLSLYQNLCYDAFYSQKSTARRGPSTLFENPAGPTKPASILIGATRWNR
jgi:hypothetical protein